MVSANIGHLGHTMWLCPSELEHKNSPLQWFAAGSTAIQTQECSLQWRAASHALAVWPLSPISDVCIPAVTAGSAGGLHAPQRLQNLHAQRGRKRPTLRLLYRDSLPEPAASAPLHASLTQLPTCAGTRPVANTACDPVLLQVSHYCEAATGYTHTDNNQVHLPEPATADQQKPQLLGCCSCSCILVAC